MARRFVRALFGPILSGRVESVAAGVMMEGRRVLRGRGDSGQRQRRNNDKRCSHSVPPNNMGSGEWGVGSGGSMSDFFDSYSPLPIPYSPLPVFEPKLSFDTPPDRIQAPRATSGG